MHFLLPRYHRKRALHINIFSRRVKKERKRRWKNQSCVAHCVVCVQGRSVIMAFWRFQVFWNFLNFVAVKFCDVCVLRAISLRAFFVSLLQFIVAHKPTSPPCRAWFAEECSRFAAAPWMRACIIHLLLTISNSCRNSLTDFSYFWTHIVRRKFVRQQTLFIHRESAEHLRIRLPPQSIPRDVYSYLFSDATSWAWRYRYGVDAFSISYSGGGYLLLHLPFGSGSTCQDLSVVEGRRVIPYRHWGWKW